MSAVPKPAVQPLTVSQLTAQVRGTLEARFLSVWVAGEVSNFTRATSGHWYFTLKDATSQIKTV
ncbi:MAG TPA: exodeoxyribonuclease VII large subunit, partial [Gemmata sp.]